MEIKENRDSLKKFFASLGIASEVHPLFSKIVGYASYSPIKISEYAYQNESAKSLVMFSQDAQRNILAKWLHWLVEGSLEEYPGFICASHSTKTFMLGF